MDFSLEDIQKAICRLRNQSNSELLTGLINGGYRFRSSNKKEVFEINGKKFNRLDIYINESRLLLQVDLINSFDIFGYHKIETLKDLNDIKIILKQGSK